MGAQSIQTRLCPPPRPPGSRPRLAPDAWPKSPLRPQGRRRPGRLPPPERSLAVDPRRGCGWCRWWPRQGKGPGRASQVLQSFADAIHQFGGSLPSEGHRYQAVRRNALVDESAYETSHQQPGLAAPRACSDKDPLTGIEYRRLLDSGKQHIRRACSRAITSCASTARGPKFAPRRAIRSRGAIEPGLACRPPHRAREPGVRSNRLWASTGSITRQPCPPSPSSPSEPAWTTPERRPSRGER